MLPHVSLALPSCLLSSCAMTRKLQVPSAEGVSPTSLAMALRAPGRTKYSPHSSPSSKVLSLYQCPKAFSSEIAFLSPSNTTQYSGLPNMRPSLDCSSCLWNAGPSTVVPTNTPPGTRCLETVVKSWRAVSRSLKAVWIANMQLTTSKVVQGLLAGTAKSASKGFPTKNSACSSVCFLAFRRSVASRMRSAELSQPKRYSALTLSHLWRSAPRRQHRSRTLNFFVGASFWMSHILAMLLKSRKARRVRIAWDGLALDQAPRAACGEDRSHRGLGDSIMPDDGRRRPLSVGVFHPMGVEAAEDFLPGVDCGVLTTDSRRLCVKRLSVSSSTPGPCSPSFASDGRAGHDTGTLPEGVTPRSPRVNSPMDPVSASRRGGAGARYFSPVLDPGERVGGVSVSSSGSSKPSGRSASGKSVSGSLS
mmetsp:Transcript_148843/g.260057  ORF Transcript_148843/g.260057 Transcript_148843/m.260057 type:complete len:420 (+) Transcript_148843:98-1357(+)